MKFVCDQCGKKFATAQDPAPGKVYKLKCTDCGHLIVVKSQADTSTAIPMAAGAGAAATGLAAAPPPALGALLGNGGELVSEAGDDPPAEPFAKRLGDSWTDLPAEVSGNFPLPAPPPPDKDELADFAAAAAEVIGAPTPRSGSGAGRDDPFMAAARASLPAGSSDRAARAAVQAAATPSISQPVPSAPAEKSRPRTEKEGGLPVAAIGFGVVVMIVITTIAVVQGKKSEPMSPPPAVVAAAPSPTPAPVETAPAPVPAPTPEPPRAEPAPAPTPVEPKPATTRPAEPKPRERRAEPRPAPPRPEPKTAAVATADPAPETDTSLVPREPTLPDAATVLTPDVVQKVVAANRRAFGACIAKASESDVKLDGRQVALRITVGPSGAVSYPTLDDASLNGTEMGQCLKSAARLMIFPKFSGDQFHIEVPLVLSAP